MARIHHYLPPGPPHRRPGLGTLSGGMLSCAKFEPGCLKMHARCSPVPDRCLCIRLAQHRLLIDQHLPKLSQHAKIFLTTDGHGLTRMKTGSLLSVFSLPLLLKKRGEGRGEADL